MQLSMPLSRAVMVDTHSSFAEGLLGNAEFKCCMASLRDTSDVSRQEL